ncbi:MAG: type VI secretion system protein TssA [Comamonas sp.]
MALDVNLLLAPISADSPCGEDASFSDLFDRIREARRFDDPNLSQGDWATELKTADWRSALDLSVKVLTTVSKDLQAAGWLAEAAINRHGLEGATDGLNVIAGLLEQYWDGLYPELDGDDADERAGKIAWLNTNLAAALQTLPLGADTAKPVNLNDWQSSREVDNLQRQNNDAWQAALAEGRMTGEAFDAAVAATPNDALSERLAASNAASAALQRLKATADERLGRASPSLAAVETALKRIGQILLKTAQAKGLAEGASAGDTGDADATPSAAATASRGGTLGTLNLSGDSAASKQAALKALGEIAGYFRRTEPHSPVSTLLDQAVRWADMPLADFLQEVVRDDSVLNAIRARVGLPQQ